MESIKPQPCRMVGCFRINMKSDTDDYFYIKRCSLIGVYRVFSAVKPGYIYLPRSGYMSPSTGDCDSCWLFGIRTLSGHLWVFFFLVPSDEYQQTWSLKPWMKAIDTVVTPLLFWIRFLRTIGLQSSSLIEGKTQWLSFMTVKM